jgi:amidase
MLIPADPSHAFVAYPDVPVPNAAAGPLAGTTFAVKDIFDVAGYVTGCGNPEKQAETKPAKANASVVQKLLDAGARFVGKTHTAELAFSLDGRNEHYGTPINPAAPDRVPGGSSSGSATAVAAGVVDFALGSDTGGSVRGPASFCGLIGLRPTFGRIDLDGTMPLAASFDTPGWFTRSMDLYEEIGAVLLGEDIDGPPLAHAVVASDAFALLEGETEHAALAAGVAAAKRALTFDGEVRIAAERLADWQAIYRVMQGREAWRAHGPWITARKPQLNPAATVRFEVASKVSEAEYQEARDLRLRAMQRVHEILGKDRVIILPTMPGAAPKLAASEEEFEAFRARALPLTSVSGISGAPQITLPVATVHGAPLGLSLIAPPGRDRALLALAAKVLAAASTG